MTDPFRLTTTSGSDRFGLVSRRKMRSGFNDLINDHPHFLIYVRRNLKYPHGDCFLSDTKSPSPDCSTCFGTGYKVQYEKHKCRRVLNAKSTQEQLMDPGYMSKYQVIIYTPRYYYPRAGDLYLEVEWDVSIPYIESIGRPVNVIKVHRVDDAVAMMEDEVTYFAVGAIPYNFDGKNLENWLLTVQRTWTEKVVN